MVDLGVVDLGVVDLPREWPIVGRRRNESLAFVKRDLLEPTEASGPRNLDGSRGIASVSRVRVTGSLLTALWWSPMVGAALARVYGAATHVSGIIPARLAPMFAAVAWRSTGWGSRCSWALGMWACMWAGPAAVEVLAELARVVTRTNGRRAP